ncbi:MAG: HAD family phosphatase [Candidatus Dormibacteraeota bacterium]|nr:HAD family phosphatase [Candidatus Dormibacteraeota bacterium]MBV9524722.1 HAD family phosphatase [Candidatus Dormibacteraeota bacterium]
MRYRVLATDYDRTIALNGVVPEATREALREVRASGRRLVLVTGRTLAELLDVFDDIALFHLLVIENGAVVRDPASGEDTALGGPVPPALVDDLKRQGVEPLVLGSVICSTALPNQRPVAEAVRRLGLDLQLSINRDSLMILPPGVDKAAGLRVALDELGETAAATVAVGDGENDLSLLTCAGVAVAVENAVDPLKAIADVVLEEPGMAGIRDLCASLVHGDLAGLLDAPQARRAG